MTVLAVNAGSSTLALSIVTAAGMRQARTVIDPWDGRDLDPLARFVADQPTPEAVGHRIVHGGPLDQASLIDDTVVALVEQAAPLAPTHQPRALAGLAATHQLLPHIPQVACFDTAFHRTIPAAASTYALPAAWRQGPLQRRGFHGLSHSHVARTAPGLLSGRFGHRPRRIVSCHLGSGASLCALADGVSIDTTMGATPLDGLVMARRSGSVDPGVLLWLLQQAGLSTAEVDDGLRNASGLAGLAGGTGDMRDILTRRSRGDPAAGLAFDVYIHRLRAGVAAMAASLGGVDLLAFTGGVGEHQSEVRESAVAGLGFLGVAIDGSLSAPDGDRDITAPGAAVGCVVVASGEDLAIAEATRHLLDGTAGTAAMNAGEGIRTTSRP